MKQLHAVAAVLLLFPNFGLTQLPRVVSLNIQATEVSTSPDGLLATENAAFNLIDGMCGQVPLGVPANYIVYGAFNMQTGIFMTWYEYMQSDGLYGDPLFNWASGSWHTFTGTCSLKPASAWIEPGFRSLGGWVYNMGTRRPRDSRYSRMNIRLPGFTAKTSTFAWRSRCKNVNQMADTFRDMPEIPGWLKHIWKGLELRVESSHFHSKSIQVPIGQEARAIATTNVVVVRAQLVLHVEKWYWYYGPAINGVASGWYGMGGQWNDIYTARAWVDASGIVQQRPEDPRDFDTPAWCYCVQIDENTVFRPHVHNRHDEPEELKD